MRTKTNDYPHSPYEDRISSEQIDLSCVYNIDRNRRKKEMPNGVKVKTAIFG